MTGEQTNAGTYTATASALTGTKAGNYKLPSGNTHSFTIGNAALTGVSATDYTGIYDAAAHGITVTAPSGATVKYRTASSGDYNLTANPTFTDAGTYTVYYQVTKPNYAAVTGSATVKINPKELTLNWSTNKTFTYNGSPQAPTATIDGVINNDVCTVSVNGAQTNYSATAYTATLGGTSIDNYILSEDGQQTTAVATINKKAVTVTALKQTVAVNGEIENSVEFAELSGALEGHELAEVTLTSSSTAKTTTEGVITPSNAKIVNGDTDVTDNYDITYIDGVMTVTKAEAEVVLDNGDDGAPASVTEVEAPNLQELADEEAEEGRLVKVELSVKPVSENKVSKATVSDVKKTVESLFAFVDMESVKVEYLEIDLTKYVDNVKEGAISDTGKPLEIILTYDTSKAGNPVIIRNHEGTVVVFTQLSARPTGSFTDATYYVEGDKIYMYSQYFSDFAIAYSVEKTFNVILNDGNGNIIRQIVSEGTKFIPPTDITKDGYDFDGWYKDEAFTEKWNPEKDKVTSDIMLYAKWEKQKEETPTTTEAPATTEETTETPTTTETSVTTEAPATTEETTETPTTTEVTTEIPVTTEEAAEKPTTTETTTETSVTTEVTTETSDVPEANVETPKSDTPKAPTTGDKINIGVIVMLMIDSVLAGLYLTLRRRLMK